MLKRFVTYIYHYDRGTRGPNVGFVKADIRDAGCRIQLQLRGLDRFQGRGKVYLIVSDEKALGIPAGEILLHQGVGQLKLAYARNQLGASGYTVTQIQAIVILCENRVLASCWTEAAPEAALTGKFQIWGEELPSDEKGEAKTAEEAPGGDSGEAEEPDDSNWTPNHDAGNSPETDSPDNATPTGDSPQTDSPNGADWTRDRDAGNSPETDSPDNATPTGDSPQTDSPGGADWTRDRAADDSTGNADDSTDNTTDDDSTDNADGDGPDRDTPTVSIADAFATPEETLISFGVADETDAADEADAADARQSNEPTVRYQKISIADIRQSLPKSNWYLCSNSFLIHGFFNYHYLMLKTVEQNGQKKRYLGVPGIYERPERTMAFMFGFPTFEPARAREENGQSPKTDAPSTLENSVFGYWMQQLMD